MLDAISNLAKKHARNMRTFTRKKAAGVFNEQDLVQEGICAGISLYYARNCTIDSKIDDFFGPTVYYAIRKFLQQNQGILKHSSDWGTFIANIDDINNERQNAVVVSYDSDYLNDSLEIPDPSGLTPAQEVEIKDYIESLDINEEERDVLFFRLDTKCDPNIKKSEIVKSLGFTKELDKKVSSWSYRKLNDIEKSLRKKVEDSGFNSY